MVQKNVWVRLVSGGVLASLAVARRSRAGYVLGALGAAMLIGGARHWRSNARSAKIKRSVPVNEIAERHAPFEDRVEMASEDSFPASDPPAWTAASL
jgi:hypothetical protein